MYGFLGLPDFLVSPETRAYQEKLGTILNPIAMARPNLGDEEIGYSAIARGAK